MADFRRLARDTIRQLAELKVRDDQETLVASNLMTMAQSIFEPGSEIFGIWQGSDPVGLLAVVDMSHPYAVLDDGDDPDGIFIWRLMVDHAHQGRGYGWDALEFSKVLARKKGRAKIVVSVVDEPGSALPLYESFGFRQTGRAVDGELELILQAKSDPSS